MSNRSGIQVLSVTPPPLAKRLYSIWFRHFRVYTKNLFSNGFPAFIEPLIFLVGVGMGLGHYVGLIDGTPYIYFPGRGHPCAFGHVYGILRMHLRHVHSPRIR